MPDPITSPIDWLKSSEPQRAKLFPVAKAIKDMQGIDDWNEFMALFMTVPVKYGSDYRGSMSSGRLKRKNALDLYNWIASNHLDIGQRLAPDIFPKSMTTPWEEFVATHATYDILKTINPSSLGLTSRDGDLQIADHPIRFGEPYCFIFKSAITGQAILLESHEGGDWHPVAIGATKDDLSADVEIKNMTVPWDATFNKPVKLREHADNGLRQFVMVIGSTQIMEEMNAKLSIGIAVSPTTLNEIAHAFTNSETVWEVHRLNVVFVR